ncbi:MAG: PQQ-dependent sugar dehydrogenase [Myxococcota bacterium]
MNVEYRGVGVVLVAVLVVACSDSDEPTVEPDPVDETTAAATCVNETSPDFGDDGQTPLNVEVVAEGLAVPWGLVWLPDGSMLVTERGGTIRKIRSDGTLEPSPVATVEITPSGEGGLLGIALHPDFASNRFFYVYATVGDGSTLRNEVQRWQMDASQANAEFESVIVGEIPALLFHNGGRLRFGPDGHLYVGTGDAGTPSLSQEVSSLAGKILRVSAEGEVPSDNPFPGEASFIIGVRNTQGFDWLPDGTLAMSDHGPSGLPAEAGREDFDEFNLAAAGDNLGWPEIYRCDTQEGMVSPRKTWARAMPPGGTAVYTGTSLPWAGDVLITVLGFDADVGHLHRISLDASGEITRSETYLRGADGFGRLREAIMGPDGHLYVTTSNCDGRGECGDGDRILRISGG